MIANTGGEFMQLGGGNNCWAKTTLHDESLALT